MFQDLSTVPQNSENPKTAFYESAVIRRLRKDLQKGSSIIESEFWRKFERESTPIVEEIAGDSENVICTFIYQGDETTKSVFVNIPPFSRIIPEDFQMSKLAETNIWYLNVKLPSKSRFAYSLVVNSPFQTVNPQSSRGKIAAFQTASQIDLLNSNRLNEKHSYIETPGVRDQKYLEKRTGSELGKIEQFVLDSEILGNRRTISVYTPPKYSSSKSHPLLVLLDENIYLDEIDAPTILDNLQAERLIPPIIAVFVGNAPDSRESELTCNPLFSEFAATELLEWAKNNYKIAGKVDETIIGGSSFGGLSAVHTGLSHPQTFGKILSQSGSFWRKFNEITAKIKNLNFPPSQKVYLDAGIYEMRSENGISLLESNRFVQKLLREKGFAVSYQEFRGGHGAVNWRNTFADGLIYLTGDLPYKQNLDGNLNLF